MASRFPYASSYGKGFARGVDILGVPIPQLPAGEVFWVSATDGSDGNKGTRNQPFATLSQAVSSAQAKRGDTVFLAPGHKETVSDAVDINKESLTIVGLGNSGSKPKITLSGGNATDGLDVSASNVTIDNIKLTAGLANLVAGIDVDATDCTIRNVTFDEPTTHLHFIHGIVSGSTTDNVCDGLTVEGCDYYAPTDGNTAFMQVVGDIKNMAVRGNKYIVGPLADASGILINGTAGDSMFGAEIVGNHMQVSTAATDTYVLVAGNDQTDNTGVVADNYIGTAKAATNATNNMIMKGTGFRYFQNYISNDVTDGSQLHPTAT